MDDFYRPASAERRLREQVLLPLSQDEGARYRRYDWARDCLAEWRTVDVGGIVAVEGVYVLGVELRDFFDFTIWVECPNAERVKRALARDGAQALEKWLTEWMPNEHRYAEAERPAEYADVILDGSSRDGIDPLRQVVEVGRRS